MSVELQHSAWRRGVAVLAIVCSLGMVLSGCGRTPVSAQATKEETASLPMDARSLSSGNQDSTVHDVAVRETTFDDLKFEMQEGDAFERSMLTPQVESLFGKSIRIRGYIYPTLKKRGLKQFVLVRDNMECCFGPGAALYDCVLVHMKEGKTAEFSIRPVAVEGDFSFEEFRDYDDTTRAIYRLDAEVVE